MKKLILVLMLATSAFGTTRYMSPSGSDATSCANSANIGTPKKSFSSALPCMGAGDTLELLDTGAITTYSVAAGTGIIDCAGSADALSGCPVNGSAGNFVTIQAHTCNGYVQIVSVDTTYTSTNLRLSTLSAASSYIHLNCLWFEKGQNQIVRGDHIWISNTGFHSSTNSVSPVFGIGSTTTGVDNSLFEDMWVWGQERVMTLNYRSDSNVWRRILISQGGCNGDGTSSACNSGGNAMVGDTTYNSAHVSKQNLLSLDSTRGTNGIAGAADFQTAFHTNFARDCGANEWLGSLSINGKLNLALMEADNPSGCSTEYTPFWTVKEMGLFTNNNSGQYGFSANLGGGIGPSANQYYDFENITAYRGAGTSVDIFGINSSFGSQASSTLININSYGVGRYGISSPKQADCVNTNGATGNYNLTTPTNRTQTTPVGTLLYAPQFPTGSFLDAACGKKGADIQFEYGTTGTFYGDAGYNTLTANPLWPWPNESIIRTQMVASGFSSDFITSGKTITGYVWDYMGTTAAPSCAITTPANGATVSGAAVSVGGTCTPLFGTCSTQPTINGSNLGTAQSGSPWSAVWNTSGGGYPDGGYTVAASATDGTGNTSSCTGTANVTVHNAAADTSVKFSGGKCSGCIIK